MSFSVSLAVQDAVAGRPWLFRLWASSRRRHRRLMVSPDTDLVIEGFPRCANSFAVVAFEAVQNGPPVTIAHHLHAESQILLGVRFGASVLVLYREPLGAVTSLVTRYPNLDVGQALARYLRFYRTVEGTAHSVVLADFHEVTSDYACVINRLNLKFGTAYQPYHNSPERDRRVFDILDRINRVDSGGRENMVSRPSMAKSRMLASRREDVRTHPRFEEAVNLYSSLRALASQSKAGRRKSSRGGSDEVVGGDSDQE